VAAQGTALKENHRPDTRAVVDTEFLDIKNDTLNRHTSIIPPIYKISNGLTREKYLLSYEIIICFFRVFWYLINKEKTLNFLKTGSATG
jgi:hypothetical protein